MIASDGQLKIADFGFARFCEPNEAPGADIRACAFIFQDLLERGKFVKSSSELVREVSKDCLELLHQMKAYETITAQQALQHRYVPISPLSHGFLA